MLLLQTSIHATGEQELRGPTTVGQQEVRGMLLWQYSGKRVFLHADNNWVHGNNSVITIVGMHPVTCIDDTYQLEYSGLVWLIWLYYVGRFS